jgi:hypothetical protein
LKELSNKIKELNAKTIQWTLLHRLEWNRKGGKSRSSTLIGWY